MKTAQQAAQAWRDSQGRATTNYEAGVNGYNGDWAGATVGQQANMLANLTQSVTSGRWAAGVNAIGTTGWKSKTVAKIANYGVGFTAGAADEAASIAKIINALQAIVPSLPPRGTFEQNKMRATTLMDAMHALRGQLGAR